MRPKKRGWKNQVNPNTPDGRQKCFKYNKGTCQGGCGRVHTCLVCNGAHPMIQRTSKPPGGGKGDAAGRVQ